MFLKRLSTALCVLMCSGFVLGANPNTKHNENSILFEESMVAPQDLTFILTPISPNCSGASNGKIDVQVVAGTGTQPYSYRIQKDGGAIQSPVNGLPLGFTISNLTKGVYKVYLTDANGQTAEQSTTIVENPPIKLDLESAVVNPLCAGGKSNILLNASGGSGSGYTYTLYRNGTIEGTNTNGDFLNLGTGIYMATVTDGVGCTKSLASTIDLRVPETINFSYTILTEINCSNGFASVQITNLPTDISTNPITIELKSGTKTYSSYSSDYIFNNLEAGDYTITVFRNSCQATDRLSKTFTISAFAPVTINASPVSPVNLNCGGPNDLTNVSLIVSGGRPDRQVRVVMDNNNGISTDDPTSIIKYGETASFSNIVAGNYLIKWSDVQNPTCANSQQYVINAPLSELKWADIPFVVTSPLCNGGPDGKVVINANGGTQPYKYYIDGVLTSAPIQKSAGSYLVRVEDAKGCITTDKTVNVSQPDALVVTHNEANDKDVTCPNLANGEFQLSITGGVGKYYYDLGTVSNPLFKVKQPTSANAVVGNLKGDVYSVTVKDDNNCVSNVITGIEIDEPDPISISLFKLDTIKCFGDKSTLAVQAIGGADPIMNYSLMKGAVEIKSLSTTGIATFNELEPASTYKIVVTSGTICKDFVERQFSIEGRKKLFVDNLIDSVMLKCPGDIPSISLTLQGESPFYYSIDGKTFQPIVGNSVVINSGLSSSVVGYPNRIVLKDRFGCETPVFITIYEPVDISGTVTSTINETCRSLNNGSISLKVTGGTTGNYLVSLVNEGTTTSIKTASSFDGNNIVLTNIPSGTYDLVIQDKNKCKDQNPTKGIFIDEPKADLTIEDPVYSPIKCFGDSTLVTFNVSGGWDYSPKKITIVQGTFRKTIDSGKSIYLKYGTYTLNASNYNASNQVECSAPQRQFTINQPPRLSITATPKGVSCFGKNDASIALNVSGGTSPFKYGLLGLGSADKSFAGNSDTISGGLVAGNYQLIVQDTNGCQSNVVPITITEPPKVTFDIKIDSVTCYNKSDGKITVVNAKGGNDILYRTYIDKVNVNYPVKDKLAAKSYSIYITDSKGCQSDVLDTTVKQPELIVPVSAFVTDSINCYNDQNGKITVNATGGLPYGLEFKLVGTKITKSYQSSNVFTGLPADETGYEVYVRNNKGNCEDKFSVSKLKLNNPPLIQTPIAKIDNVTCHNLQNGTVDIGTTGGTGTLNYLITNSSSIIADNPNYTGKFRNLGDKNKANTNYNYRIEDVKGCFKTGSFTIKNPDAIEMTYISHEQVTCNSKSDGWIKVEVKGGTGNYSFLQNIGFTDKATFELIPSNTYIIKGYPGGSYTPIVLDAESCVDTLEQLVEIYEPQPIEISSIEWGEKLCNGNMDEKSVIHVIGGTPDYRYSLDDGASWSAANDSVFVGIPIGVKQPLVKDKFECVTPKYKEFLMAEPELLTAKTTFYDIKCHDDKYGDLKLDLAGGVGPYSFSIDDPTFETNVTEIAKTEKDTTSFMLSKNDILLFPDITYKFYVRDANKCNVRNIDGVNSFIKPIAEKLFLIPKELVLDSLQQIGVKCDDDNTGVIKFNASGGTIDILNGYKLIVTNQERNITKQNTNGFLQVGELFSGQYKVELQDANGCIGKTRLSPLSYDTISVDAANRSIKLNISAIEVPKCNRVYNGWIEVDVADFYEEGVSYLVERWDSVLGKYTMEDPKWQGIIPAEPDYSNQVEGHELFFANGVRIVENIGIGKYIVTVIDNQSNCNTDVDTLIVSADGDECPPLRYFNVFSPHNGDDVNNEWTLYGSEFQNYTLQIFTSYGELVYTDKGRSDVKGITWKGIDQRNRPVPVGTYIYLLRKNEGTPQDTTINGNITILRGNGR
jgi:hypothetical protein